MATSKIKPRIVLRSTTATTDAAGQFTPSLNDGEKLIGIMIGYSNGGTNYKRASVSGANISVVGAVVAGDFASGYFIPSAV